ncbi:unnamed protein product [Spodoptera littoralis]|uniref:Carbonic anhydrase n=1 Tax=Spodoptera littoralis TaxID=7109 RepID=A0A9P0HVX5_SPOLI|nr:unnamed protein product [Spodoptera littoralis]CAH1635497.1 unnamed protein product [Spodoptera littoralis]
MLIFVFILSPFLLEIVAVTPETKASTADLIWSYDDESKWPGKLCQSGGKRQSPIDIRTADVVRDFRKEFIKYGPLKFTGYQKVLTTGINNGHTIQFSTEGEDLMHPLVSGGPLKHRYRLEQLHFHWLSEHAVNGIKYPMEIHFVHVRADLTVNQALHRKDGLAIISVFGNKAVKCRQVVILHIRGVPDVTRLQRGRHLDHLHIANILIGCTVPHVRQHRHSTAQLQESPGTKPAGGVHAGGDKGQGATDRPVFRRRRQGGH